MRLREPTELRHIHQWRLYVPSTEQELQQYLDALVPQDNAPWTYRRCDCGAKMRCLSWVLATYPRDFRAFADEAWEDV